MAKLRANKPELARFEHTIIRESDDPTIRPTLHRFQVTFHKNLKSLHRHIKKTGLAPARFGDWRLRRTFETTEGMETAISGFRESNTWTEILQTEPAVPIPKTGTCSV